MSNTIPEMKEATETRFPMTVERRITRTDDTKKEAWAKDFSRYTVKCAEDMMNVNEVIMIRNKSNLKCPVRMANENSALLSFI